MRFSVLPSFLVATALWEWQHSHTYCDVDICKIRSMSCFIVSQSTSVDHLRLPTQSVELIIQYTTSYKCRLYFSVCTAEFRGVVLPCQSRSCCHFGRVTLLSVMQQGELAWRMLAMTGIPLTISVLLLMASRHKASQTLTPMLRHVLAQTVAAKYAHVHNETNVQTQTHTSPSHIVFHPPAELQLKSLVW